MEAVNSSFPTNPKLVTVQLKLSAWVVRHLNYGIDKSYIFSVQSRVWAKGWSFKVRRSHERKITYLLVGLIVNRPYLWSWEGRIKNSRGLPWPRLYSEDHFGSVFYLYSIPGKGERDRHNAKDRPARFSFFPFFSD